MPHPIPAPDLIPYKEGDRVRHINSGQYATVAEDQTDPILIKINWDKNPEGPQDYRSDAFEVAPWHGLAEPVHVRNFREAGLLDPEKLPKPDAAPAKPVADELNELAEELFSAERQPNAFRMRLMLLGVAHKLQSIAEDL